MSYVPSRAREIAWNVEGAMILAGLRAACHAYTQAMGSCVTDSLHPELSDRAPVAAGAPEREPDPAQPIDGEEFVPVADPDAADDGSVRETIVDSPQDCPCPSAFKRVAYCDDCPYAPLREAERQARLRRWATP